MISYDLRCSKDHVFEAWFKDRQAFLDQKKEGLVECPICLSSEVDIAFTSCYVKTGKNALKSDGSLLHKLQKYLDHNFEDVGEGFAEEAKRIHHEEAERRNIRGVTTPQEEKELKEEGIDFIKIPYFKLDS